MPLMFIDSDDGYTYMPMGKNFLEAADFAKRVNGRLRLVVSRDMSTTDPTVGCEVLCDFRANKGADHA